MADIDYAAAMKLPDEANCDGCVHAKRCFGFGFSKPGRTACDFYPSRYRAALSPPHVRPQAETEAKQP